MCGVKHDWRHQNDVEGIGCNGNSGRMDGATSTAHHNSKQVETDTLAVSGTQTTMTQSESLCRLMRKYIQDNEYNMIYKGLYTTIHVVNMRYDVSSSGM